MASFWVKTRFFFLPCFFFVLLLVLYPLPIILLNLILRLFRSSTEMREKAAGKDFICVCRPRQHQGPPFSVVGTKMPPKISLLRHHWPPPVHVLHGKKWTRDCWGQFCMHIGEWSPCIRFSISMHQFGSLHMNAVIVHAKLKMQVWSLF